MISASTRLDRHLRFRVDIDHLATFLNARGECHPDTVRAAHVAVEAGADAITAHRATLASCG